MKTHCIVFVVISLFISINSGADPSKPVWPSEFQLPFGLHFTPLVTNGSAVLYYNYDQVQSQLIVYDTHCFPLIRYNSIEYPCKMYFNPKGIFVSIPKLDITCCLYVADVGAVPPTFLQGFNYSGHNETVHDILQTLHLQWDGADDFKYWTDVQTGFDVQFQDGASGVQWNFGDMTVAAQSPSLFDLPSSNCSTKCAFFDAFQLFGKHANIPFIFPH